MSKTQQKIDDLRTNGVSTQKPTKADIDSIEQLRRRFIADGKKAVQAFLSQQKRSKMVQIAANPLYPDGDRILLELERAQVVVEYDGVTYQRSLTEDDIMMLVVGKYKRWKTFLLSRHFRHELNYQMD